MYRTDEAIYQRAQEEQLKRPPDWEAEDIDSVRVSYEKENYFKFIFKSLKLQ